ncbi:MAG: DUF4135 domain-containing protein, partial [Prosthecobacter sp.]
TAAVLHQQLGQLSALMLVAGVRDLHHTNMMISGGQPYLTDVEIAFDQDLLHTFGKNVNDAANNLAGASIGGSIMSSQLNLMWENGGESVRLDTEYVVEDDHLISNPKGTTFAAEGVTENMLIVDGQGANRNLSEGMPVSVHTHYSDQVADGFSKMLSSLAKDATAVGRIKAFIDSTTGMHVRHHPIATGNQLAILQAGRTDKFYSSPQLTDLDTSIQTAVGANIQLKRGQIDNREREELKVPIECTQNAMVSDLKKGDVPYFTRELGSDALHHNSTTALNVNPSDDPIYAQKFFSEDPLAMAKLNLDNIAANLNVTVATLANSYKNYVDNLNVPYMNPSVKEDFAKKIGPEMAAQIGAPVNLILLAQRQRAAQNGPALPGAGGMGI